MPSSTGLLASSLRIAKYSVRPTPGSFGAGKRCRACRWQTAWSDLLRGATECILQAEAPPPPSRARKLTRARLTRRLPQVVRPVINPKAGWAGIGKGWWSQAGLNRRPLARHESSP